MEHLLTAYTLMLSAFGIWQMKLAADGDAKAWPLLLLNQLLWIPFIWFT